MRRSLAFALVLLAAGHATAAEQGFDQRVSEARLHMRAACQVVQQAANVPAADQAGLTARALDEASQAERLWTDLAKAYAARIPEGYAGDPAWARRLEDIRLNIARMRSDIAAGGWRPGFLSCAHACSLIAAMHEANGVVLAIDTMTTVRKKVGLARGLLAAGSTSKALSLVKEIMAARDAVLLSPAPNTPSRDAYLAALPELTQAVDALAAAVRNGADVKVGFDRLAPIVERVYELAI
jgi:hypothetical protein